MPGRFTISEQLDQMPFLRMLIPLIFGVVVADYITAPAGFLLALMGGLIAAYLLFRGDRLRQSLLTLLIFILGISCARVLTPRETMPRNERLVISGRIDDNVTTSGRWHRTTAQVIAYRPDDSTAVWQSCDEMVSLYVDTAYTIAIGERFSAVAYINPLDTVGGTTGYARTMRSRGLLGRAYVIDGHLLAHEPIPPDTPWGWLIRASKKVQHAIVCRLAEFDMDERELGIAMALLAGDRSLIDPELREDYSKAGVSHLLAISGLHLGILFALLNYLLAPLLFARRGRAIRTVLVILCLWGYAFISGLSASVLRAAFMLSILQLSMMTVWNYNSYNALFASAFVLILIRPTFIYDLSFQMSYLALLGILFFYPRFSRWTGVTKAGSWFRRRRDQARGPAYYVWVFVANLFIFMTGAILIGLSAQITVAPLVGWAFGRMPLVSLLANPFIMLVVTWLMVAGFCYLMLANVPGLGWLAGVIMKWLLERQNRWIEWIATLPGASIEKVSFSLPALFGIYAAMLLVMTGIKYFEQRKHAKPLPDVPAFS